MKKLHLQQILSKKIRPADISTEKKYRIAEKKIICNQVGSWIE